MARKFNFNLKDIKHKKIKHHLGKKVNQAADKLVEKEPLRIRNLRQFAQRHMILLLVTFIVFVAVISGIIWVVNYNTAYQYSYNGRTLGVVKDKDDVLTITSLVSEALTEEKDAEVVIDKKKDITFKRVAIIGSDIHVDTSEDVLRRMTYVGNINVNGYGITVDGKTAVILDSRESAEKVIQTVKNDYLQVGDNTIVEDAEFVENVSIKEINTDLENLQSQGEAVDVLKTGGTNRSVHTVAAGETFAGLAEQYGLTEEELYKLNPTVDPKKLEVGSEMTISTRGPMVTMEASQLITYEEQIAFEVIETKTADMYEGDKKITQKGQNGVRVVTARVESTNGEITQSTPVVEIVESQPTEQKVLVGTAKRPPSIGDGKFIWPAAKGSFRVSSEFGWRWGRLHAGIDLACSVGTDVLAADGGTVTFAGYHKTYGNLVIIDHHNGYETYYAHNSKLLVSKGDKVYEGYHIAESGNTGRSTGPHIHLEIHVNGTAKNPRGYLP